MPDLLQDLHYAFRHLGRSPGFAAAAIMTVALGVGANAAVLSILNALVLRQLPIPDPTGLVAVAGRNAQNQPRLTPIPAVEELTREGPLQHVCGYNGGVILAVEANGTPAQALGALVTGQCFKAFGVAPIHGRSIEDGDAPLLQPGGHVAVIGHRFWTRMFGANPEAVGKRIRTEGAELTIIGVLPPQFAGLHIDSGVDLFVPFDSVLPARADRRPGASHIIGRLRPGVSFEQASAELTTRWPAILELAVPATLAAPERADLRSAHPRAERIGTGLSTLRERYASPLTIMATLTGVLLLLACINLGGLLLARLASRGHEISVRLALGATGWRIARQLLVESLVLSLIGAALAVPVAFAIVARLSSFLPVGQVERIITLTPDVSVLAATVLIGTIGGLLMSAAPMWVCRRRHVAAHASWDRTVAGTSSRWGRALVVAQVALSLLMLVGAGLLTRSLYLLQHVDSGVRVDGVLHVRVMPFPNAYRDIDNASYYPALLEKLAGLPGVQSVGYARAFPRLTIENPGLPIAFVGEPSGDARATMDTVSPGFFETVDIPLVRGRVTSWLDNAKTLQVAVVNERLAQALARDDDVIGRRVRFGVERIHQDVTIVGIVRNATLGNPRQAAPPVFYRPALQTGGFGNYPSLAIATSGDMSLVAAGVRRVLKESGREYAHEIIPIADVLARAPASERMSATLAGAIAVLAGVLAILGIYGLLADTVSRRTREIGVRVAVGAEPRAVVRMVVREGFVLTSIGVAIGVPAALVAARALRTLMFGVNDADPWVFAAAIALLSISGLAAGIVPARRAASVDPMVALRADE